MNGAVDRHDFCMLHRGHLVICNIFMVASNKTLPPLQFDCMIICVQVENTNL